MSVSRSSYVVQKRGCSGAVFLESRKGTMDDETEKLPVLWFGRDRAWKNPSAARGYRVDAASVVVRVLVMRMAGADTVDKAKGCSGVEQGGGKEG